jgi:5-methylcytosine-specific restriction enzyme subunit McrC
LKYALDLAIKTIVILLNQPLSRERKNELSVLGLIMRDIDDLFSSIPLDRSLKYVPEVINSLNNGSIPETRDYYVDACRTALLLVEGAGIIPTLEVKDSTISFVVNMETIFEDYVFNVLRSYASQFRWVNVIRGSSEQRKMFSGDNCDTRNVEPDIVIEDVNHRKIPIELKYKDTPNRDNINQAITYAIAYQIGIAILVCFTNKVSNTGWKYFGKIGNQIDVWVYFLNLDSDDMYAEEGRFANNINGKIS